MGNTKSKSLVHEEIKDKIECIIVEPKEFYLKLDKINIHRNHAFIYFIPKKKIKYNIITFMIHLPNKEIIEETVDLNSSLTEIITKEKHEKKNILQKSIYHNNYEIMIRLSYDINLNSIVLKMKSNELFTN